MVSDDPIRYTLSDQTNVVVRKVTNNKYDFELKLPNGNRKTFIWPNGINEFSDRNGNADGLISEAIKQFVEIINC